jgi:hypothetical protein
MVLANDVAWALGALFRSADGGNGWALLAKKGFLVSKRGLSPYFYLNQGVNYRVAIISDMWYPFPISSSQENWALRSKIRWTGAGLPAAL